jgi:ferric-dicitrate binding protein FerR (iron transport regulator)
MKLTQEERRRMFVAQQAARRAMLDRLRQPAHIESSAPAPSIRRRWLKTVAIAMLIGGGLLAYSVVQFHPPTSIEALLPRL